MKYPQIILLNGASSSGKTTLCNELRKHIDHPYFYYSSDQLVDSGMLPPMDRSHHDTIWSWNIIRPHFFSGFHRSIAAFAESGNYLLVEHVVETKEYLHELVLLLHPFSVFYIGVHCPPEEIDRRERNRGNRDIGEGRGHLEDGIHNWSDYDLSVDTHLNSPQHNAELIISTMEKTTRAKNIFQLKFMDLGHEQ